MQRKFTGQAFSEVDLQTTFYVAIMYFWDYGYYCNRWNIFEIEVKTARLLIGQKVNRLSES